MNFKNTDSWSVKKSGKFIINSKNMVVSGLALLVALASTSASALPSGGVVSTGNATIINGVNSTTINQTSNAAAINWNSFNVGSSESVAFNVPTNTSVTVNRIMSSGAASLINGAVSSNGNLVFINPNGMIFGSGANVTAHGIVATTANISDSSINSSTNNIYHFDQAGSNETAAIVVDAGANITTSSGGKVIALVAPKVENHGNINSGSYTANDGNAVILASARTSYVALDGDPLINIADVGGVGIAPVVKGIPFKLDENSKVKGYVGEHAVSTDTNNVQGRVVALVADVNNDLYSNAISHDGSIYAGNLIISQNGAELGDNSVAGNDENLGVVADLLGGTEVAIDEVVEDNAAQVALAQTASDAAGKSVAGATSRPLVSAINNSVINNSTLDGINTSGNLSLSGSAELASIAPASGNDNLSGIEPAAGGNISNASNTNTDCANAFLSDQDKDCDLEQ